MSAQASGSILNPASDTCDAIEASVSTCRDRHPKGALREFPGFHPLEVDLEGLTDIHVTGAASLQSLQQWPTNSDVAFAHSRARFDLIALLDQLGLSSGVVRHITNHEAATDCPRPTSSVRPTEGSHRWLITRPQPPSWSR